MDASNVTEVVGGAVSAVNLIKMGQWLAASVAVIKTLVWLSKTPVFGRAWYRLFADRTVTFLGRSINLVDLRPVVPVLLGVVGAVIGNVVGGVAWNDALMMALSGPVAGSLHDVLTGMGWGHPSAGPPPTPSPAETDVTDAEAMARFNDSGRGGRGPSV